MCLTILCGLALKGLTINQMLIFKGGKSHRVAVFLLHAIQLKVRGGHSDANKHLNVRRWVEVVPSFQIRSSCQQVFYQEDVLRNFAKFTGKHLCVLSLFSSKVAGLRPQACNFIKKETLTQVLPCEF